MHEGQTLTPAENGELAFRSWLSGAMVGFMGEAAGNGHAVAFAGTIAGENQTRIDALKAKAAGREPSPVMQAAGRRTKTA